MENGKKNYSLYAVLAFLFLVIFLITSAFTYFSIRDQRQRLIDEEVQKNIDLAEMINQVLYSPVTEHRIGMFPGMKNVLMEEMGRIQGIAYVRVISESGTIQESSVSGEWGGTVEDELIEINLKEIDSVKRARSEFENQKVKYVLYPGYDDKIIWVGFFLDPVESLIRETRQQTVLVNLGSLLVIIFVVFVILRTSIINPIRKIVRACQRIKEGNLNTEINIESKTEIGEFASVFNRMIANLRESKEELQEFNQELEEAVEELEKFRKLTVGRELKMVKLKEEKKKLQNKIEELERKIKKYEKKA